MTTSPYVPPLPSYLTPEQATEPEHLPLQLLLLTHEVASLRQRVSLLSKALIELGQAISPPAGDPTSDE